MGGSILTRNLDTEYSYDAEGNATEIIYPTTYSGGVATSGQPYYYTYDQMERLIALYNQPPIIGKPLINNVAYDAANRLLQFGYSSGYAETRKYNSLEQLTQLNTPGGAVYTYNYPTGANNGKLSSAVVSGETITYQYDSLNRLSSASGSGWGNSYGYDGFGNLLSKTITQGSAPSLSQAVNAANNQIVGQSYDLNGNQLTAPGVTGSVTYDVENRMLAAPGVQYAYDSQNKRVWSATLDSKGNLLSQTAYVYGVDGRQLGAYTLTVSGTQISDPPLETDVYFAGRRVFVNGNAFSEDQLGSNASGSLFPWGEPRGLNPQNTWSFATYWRDSASGLDYASNRYYSNAYGRFMSPDPYKGTSGGSGDPGNPQSWNRYAYTTGDPVNWVDSQGLFQECPACSIYNSDNTTVVQTFSSTSYNFSSYYSAAGAAAAQAAMSAYYQALRYQQMLTSALSSAQTAVASDLAKPGCAKDFKNVANDLNKLSQIGFSNFGVPTFVTNNQGQTVPKGQNPLQWMRNPCFNSIGCYNPFTKSINLNSSINWLDPSSQTATLNGSPFTYNALSSEGGIVGDSSITTAQFMDITILHELAHYNGAIGSPDNAAVEAQLWKDCIK